MTDKGPVWQPLPCLWWYDNPAYLEDAVYLVRVDGKFEICEFLGGQWWRHGIDYDVWQYQPGDPPTIEVLRKLDLEALATPVAARHSFDGHGYRYTDSGSGSDWAIRHKDAEMLYK